MLMSHIYTPWKLPLVFWRFKGVYKWNNDLKWVKYYFTEVRLLHKNGVLRIFSVNVTKSALVIRANNFDWFETKLFVISKSICTSNFKHFSYWDTEIGMARLTLVRGVFRAMSNIYGRASIVSRVLKKQRRI